LLGIFSVGHGWVNEHGVLVEWYWQAKTENSQKNLTKCHFVHHKSTGTGLTAWRHHYWHHSSSGIQPVEQRGYEILFELCAV
jgi:hypothetical protein